MEKRREWKANAIFRTYQLLGLGVGEGELSTVMQKGLQVRARAISVKHQTAAPASPLISASLERCTQLQARTQPWNGPGGPALPFEWHYQSSEEEKHWTAADNEISRFARSRKDLRQNTESCGLLFFYSPRNLAAVR